MRKPELIDNLLTDSDPLEGLPQSDPDGAVALAVRDRATKGRDQQQRTLRRIVAACAAAGLLGAAGATVAYSNGDGRSGSSDGLVCNGSDASDLVVGFDPRSDDPAAVCAGEWEIVFGVPAPAELTACVDSGVQGSIEVYPGAAEVCAENDSVPYTGPTDEQLRFAAFREDADSLHEILQPTRDQCVTEEQIKRALDPLLAKHRLEGWTYGSPVDNDAPCAQVEGFVEHNKTIVITHHPRQ